jgi:hypothetical protein
VFALKKPYNAGVMFFRAILFPFFLIRLLFAAVPSLIWLMCLSFKQWKLLVSLVLLLCGLAHFGLQNLSPTPPFQQALTPNEKLNRQLKPFNGTYVQFSGEQPLLTQWAITKAKYPEHRDVLLQTSLAAFYAGQYKQAETLWQEARVIDPLYPIFKDVPELTPLAQ